MGIRDGEQILELMQAYQFPACSQQQLTWIYLRTRSSAQTAAEVATAAVVTCVRQLFCSTR